MDQHYEVILMGAGYLSQAQLNGSGNAQQSQNRAVSSSNNGGGQWQQLLSGSLLYQTKTDSGSGYLIQTTELMHMCPDGNVHFYQRSGGGGGNITANQQVQYTGSATWAVIENGGQAFLQMNLQGQAGNFPIQIVNGKVVIQGLGALSVERGAAQCQ